MNLLNQHQSDPETGIPSSRRMGRSRGGFTLVEIMAVIVIIGLLAAATTVAVMGSIGKARSETTRASITSIENAANRFKMDTSDYPKKLEDLVEKPGYVSEREWAGPYLKKVPLDGWGNEFKYRVRGSKMVIKSLGADDQPGGQGENADISNMTMREREEK